MAGYDGSIVINTLLATEAFQAGLRNLSTKFQRVAASLGNVLKRALTGAMVIFALSAVKIFQTIRDNIGMLLERSGLTPRVEEIQNRFEELKVAVANAFLPLVVAALPYIKIAVVWLTEMFNKVAMIVAALMGQKQVLQVISGSAYTLAKNTEKAAKAARGALAAFDQINVLNSQDAAVQGPDLTPAQTVATEMVPVTDEILQKVADIKQQFLDAWTAIRDGAVAAWNFVVAAWQNASAWFQNSVVAPVKQFFAEMWEGVQNGFAAGGAVFSALGVGGTLLLDIFYKVYQVAQWAWNGIVEAWKGAAEWLSSVANNAREKIQEAWGAISDWFRANVSGPISAKFSEAWEAIRSAASTAWENIRSIVSAAKDRILAVWSTIGEWFTRNVSDPIRGAFSTALDFVKDKFATVFDGIKSVARSVINSVIGFFNTMFDVSTAALNGLIDGANSFGSTIPGWVAIPNLSAPQIPYLATGAVIPPNSQFLAVLGDQRSGNNIEAPEGLIRQIIREEMGTISGNFTFGFEGSMASLVREMRPYIVKEDVRIGSSFVGTTK